MFLVFNFWGELGEVWRGWMVLTQSFVEDGDWMRLLFGGVRGMRAGLMSDNDPDFKKPPKKYHPKGITFSMRIGIFWWWRR